MHEAAINGFGRFGLGLFQACFNDRSSNYAIKHINDATLSAQEIRDILKNDQYIDRFHKCRIDIIGNRLVIIEKNKAVANFNVTNEPLHTTSWLGEPDIVFECSTNVQDQEGLYGLITGNTSNVIAGAVLDHVETILIYGYNHEAYAPASDTVVSFGSCTVIPGVHVLSAIRELSDVTQGCINVLHSVPQWQLDRGQWPSLKRKACTLERAARQLMPDLGNRIKVNYTYAPYSGVSLMDFSFTTKNRLSENDIQNTFKSQSTTGRWRDIIAIDPSDRGGEHYSSSQHSLVIIEESLDVRENNIYFYGYFNNEGSGIRLHDLAKHVLRTNVKQKQLQ